MDLTRDEQLRRFEALIHASGDFIAIASVDGKIEFINRAAQELIGMPGDVVVSQTRIEDYLTPEGQRASAAIEQPAVVRDEHWNGTGTLRDWRGGPPIPVEISSFLIRDTRTGEPLALATVQRDLRERVAAERQVAAAQSALRAAEERQQALLLHMSDLLVVIAADSAIVYAGPSAALVLGYRPGEKLGGILLDLVHPEDRAGVADHLAAVFARPGLSPAVELRLQAADGSWRRYEAITNNLLEDPTVGGVVVTARDVTERHRAEHALLSQARILEQIARGTSITEVLIALASEVEAQLPGIACSVLLVDGPPEGRVLRHLAAPSMPQDYHAAVDGLPVNATASPCSLAALTGEPVLVPDVRQDPRWQQFHQLAELCEVRACWALPIRSPATDESIGTVTLYRAEPGLPAGHALELVEQASHLVGIAVDRSHFEQRLAHQATHDELTGLPNRTLFLDRLELALGRHQRDPRAVPVVVFLDLDRLKIVNDSLGHDLGDELLIVVARRLKALMRSTDTVARFGGDEFVIVAEEADALDAPVRLTERILAAVAEPVELAGRRISPSASAGVVVAAGYDTAGAALRDADIAMYRAKHRGGAGYELFDTSMRERAVQRLDLEAQIRRGIHEGQFRVFYQPVLDLLEHRVTGLEALVRWEHPRRGLLGPAAFIDVAEETGLIAELGEWVLQQAARTIAGWALPVTGGPLDLSVNVAARQLYSPGLHRAVAAAVATIAPWTLCLELTESTLMDDTALARGLITQLTQSGASLSIDDFGTGYSSLSYLTRLPVTTLKIDRSFVTDLGKVDEAETVAAAIISLGDRLGLKVIAEGVETADQQRVLLALGCRNAQGFLFSRPVPEAEARALLT
ncbi:MAG TPA: EAL domain-containing protein [Mycobacteriales bacterium]|nr:EAL domain-containing protein [Mycobacteriales bacterium]